MSITYSVSFFGGPTADTISGMHCTWLSRLEKWLPYRLVTYRSKLARNGKQISYELLKMKQMCFLKLSPSNFIYYISSSRGNRSLRLSILCNFNLMGKSVSCSAFYFRVIRYNKFHYQFCAEVVFKKKINRMNSPGSAAEKSSEKGKSDISACFFPYSIGRI